MKRNNYFRDNNQRPLTREQLRCRLKRDNQFFWEDYRSPIAGKILQTSDNIHKQEQSSPKPKTSLM